MYALLPMKAHSERIPDKNFKLLCLYWLVNTCDQSYDVCNDLAIWSWSNFGESLAFSLDSQDIVVFGASVEYTKAMALLSLTSGMLIYFPAFWW